VKDKAIIYCSLAVSIAALVYSIWVRQNARPMVDQALRQREQQFVSALAPRIGMALRDMGATNIAANPKTLEELFGPLVDMMNGIEGVTNESGARRVKP